MPMYYLYDSDNKVQPSQFINNKAAGILFENKIDHATYFSAELKCIQGIHMLPLLPSSPYIRQAKFVREEWEAFFDGRMEDIRDGWKSVIYGNYATIEPQKAWEYFTSPTFDPAWLDGGASLTWYMAYAAGKCLFCCFLFSHYTHLVKWKANSLGRSNGKFVKRTVAAKGYKTGDDGSSGRGGYAMHFHD